MEEDDGLELSLCLSFGGSAGKSKTSAPHHTGGKGSSSILVGGTRNVSQLSLQNFFVTGECPDHEKHRTERNSSQNEPFFSSLGKFSDPAAEGSNYLHSETQFPRHQELGSSKADSNEEKSAPNKRKLPFDDIGLQRKSEKTSDNRKSPIDFISVRQSHISATSLDYSTGENQDVVEAEGSTSRLVTQHEEGSRGSTAPKFPDKHVSTDVTTPYALTFSSPSLMPVRPLTVGEHSLIQTTNSSNLQLGLSCSTAQPQTDSLLPRDYAGGAPNPDLSENAVKIPHAQATRSSAATWTYEKYAPNLAEVSDKKIEEVGTSTQGEDKGSATNFIQLLAEGSTIRPGITSDVKFGGSGSQPDLPWVSTTGPDGQTISGVSYKYNKDQIKIVCACHGSHMSQEEFIQHAKADDPNSENNTSRHEMGAVAKHIKGDK